MTPPRCPHCNGALPATYYVAVQETVSRIFQVEALSQAAALDALRRELPPGDHRDRDWQPDAVAPFPEVDVYLKSRTAPTSSNYRPERCCA